jgi:hypothetical protein
MSKCPVFHDNDWPLESRKKVIKGLPANVHDCIQKIVVFASKPDSKEPPNLQQLIEQHIFNLTNDRKPPMNPVMFFKVLNVIAAAFVFDLKTDEARKIFFERLFLGREGVNDSPAHDTRISALIRFSSLALQYPMAFYFDILAEWLLKNDNYLKYATRIFAEICNGYLLRPYDWELTAFVEPLEASSFEFSALAALYLVNKEYFAEPHSAQIISVIGKWYAKRAADYLTFYAKYANLAKDFALKVSHCFITVLHIFL